MNQETKSSARDVVTAIGVAALSNAASLAATVFAGLLFTSDRWEYACVMAFVAWRTHTSHKIEIR